MDEVSGVARLSLFSRLKMHVREHPMAYRMLGYVIAFSSVFTVLGAGLELFWEYRTDVRRIELILQQVAESHLNGLGTSLWLLDDARTRDQMEGILQQPDICYVDVESSEGQRTTLGTEIPKRHVFRAYDISHQHRDRLHGVGRLRVAASLEGVHDRLLNKSLVTLFTQGLRTFLTSLFILFVVQYMFTRHLRTLARHAARLKLNQLDSPLTLDRRQQGKLRPDELDLLVDAMEDMRHRLALDLESIRQSREEREQLISDLEAKNQEMESFTYTVSHDLKSPLVTIQNFSGLIQRDLEKGNSERAQHDIERVKAASRKMYQMLEDLLALSRAGHLIGQGEPVAITPLAEEVVELLSGPIAEANAQVVVAQGMPVVFGDALRLRTLIQNLVENGIKFSAEEGTPRIDVGWRPAKDDHPDIFFVADQGQGIAERDRETIFDLFNKLDTTSAGSGIGLALAQRIVAVHRGQIWAESAGLGRGSTICFTLRLQPGDETAAGPKPSPQGKV